MAEKKVISGSDVMAHAVKMCRPKVLPMYPITPSTLIPERLSEFVNNGELESKIIYVEIEHSAASALYGAYATGVRSFTATASQGLALMHEIIPIIAGSRFPAVMAVANRALSGPLNIWNDQSDTISERDQGWIQLYCENNQEAFDTLIMAYKIAENSKVLTPVMVCVDGFYLTHAYEPVQIEDQKDIDEFLPEYKPLHFLDTSSPKTFGAFAQPNSYMDFKLEQEIAIQESIKVITEVNSEFGKKFGRSYGDGLIEEYNTKKAKVALLCLGSVSGTIKEVIDEYKAKGKEIGLIRLKAYRPFPIEQLKKATKGIKNLGVIDKHASIGFGGALTNDVKAALFGEKIQIESFMAGLGGRDIDRAKIRDAIETIMKGKEGKWLK